MSIKTEEELAEAIENNQESIEIEGNLATKVIKIKATGKIAWVIALGAIAIAVTTVVLTGGTATPASAIVAGGAVSILGLSTTVTAIAIAVAGRGVGILNKLRDYEIVSNKDDKVILKK